MSVQHNIRVIYGFVVYDHHESFYNPGEEAECDSVHDYLFGLGLDVVYDDEVAIVGVQLDALYDYTRSYSVFIKLEGVREPTEKEKYRVETVRDALLKLVPDRIRDRHIGVYIFGEVS